MTERRFKEFRRPIREILQDLSKPIPERLQKVKVIQSTQIKYIPWHTVCKLLDFYAPGWSGYVADTTVVGDRFVLTYRITILAEEGEFCREATGSEDIFKENESGDLSSNAEAMAFRRAAAKFGLGLHLYEG